MRHGARAYGIAQRGRRGLQCLALRFDGCSQTEALRLLLNSGSIASVPRKLGNRQGSLLRKMLSGIFLAVWGGVTEVIVYWKTAVTRRRA